MYNSPVVYDLYKASGYVKTSSHNFNYVNLSFTIIDMKNGNISTFIKEVSIYLGKFK